MDRHSYSNKGLPFGFPGQTGSDSMKSSDMAGSGDFGLLTVSDLRRTFTVIKHPYIISKAYSEPIGSDPIEQFILQRNYIID